MANRFPLVLDTTDNNKIKEIQAGDNLNLADNSIVGVQNITALGTIDAADIRVAGNRLIAQTFADLTDTPASFIGAPNYFVKVKADGTGLEYRPLSDLGNIEIDTITVDTSIIPSADGVGNIGSEDFKFNEIVAATLKGNLVSYNDEIVFNATTGLISYAALQGAPGFLSEFTDDVGYLRTTDLDTTLAGLFDDGVPFTTDIVGSVFGDDSTILVDGVNSIITGDVLNTAIDTAQLTASQIISTAVTAQLFEGPPLGDMQIDAGITGIINIGTGASTTAVNIENAVIETFDQGSGLGVAQITANTDLSITAGNRVKIQGGIPFRFASTTADLQLAIAAQEGDVIYNTTTSRLQMYQDATWKDVNGNVEATTGTSNFNNIVVAGNLTVQGTTTTIDTTNTTIKDNLIILNHGELGVGVTLGTSGIEIERGDLANVTFVWNDAVDKWTLGSETLVAAAFEGNLSGNVTGNVTGNTNGTHTGAVVGDVTGNVTGNVVGDIVGSVFGDDSTLLVDAVGNNLNASKLTIDTVESTSGLILLSQGGINMTASTSALLRSLAGNFRIIADGGVASLESASGSGSISVNGDTNEISIGSTNSVTIQGAANAPVNIGTGSSGPVTLGNGSNTIAFTSGTAVNFNGATISNFSGSITGSVTGNIDNATLTIGATTATSIAIGNASSTTTINGIVSLPALIAGEITADNSISITTATGDGNAISIGPGGTNRFINLTADYIRFFGPITQNINAQAGITGDLTGSIFGDDSTILVDAVNSTIPYGVLDGAPANLSDFNNDLDYAAIVGTAIQNNGLPVDTFMTGTLDAQGNDIENANLVNATGTLDGDVVGSVFADDSSVMVDAVNFTMFTDAMTLTPLNAEPVQLVSGMLVAADGVSWDPAAKVGAVPYPVFYDGVAWNALY